MTPGASLGTYMSMYTNFREFLAHLRHFILGKKQNFFSFSNFGDYYGRIRIFSKFLLGLSHKKRPRTRLWACTRTRGNYGYIWDRILQQKLENFFSLWLWGLLWEDPDFPLNFCWVYHTSSALGHVYGCAHQLEVIVGTFEIENLWQKLENLFHSLIMGLMGGSKFFCKFFVRFIRPAAP